MSRFDWSVCVAKSSVESCLEFGLIQIRGGQGRGEQHRGFLTKALMQDLATRLDLDIGFCENWRNIVEINQ